MNGNSVMKTILFLLGAGMISAAPLTINIKNIKADLSSSAVTEYSTFKCKQFATMKENDTIESISHRYHTSPGALKKMNGASFETELSVGDALCVVGEAAL